MKRKIRKRCKCGCGGFANYGRIWIRGHHLFDNTHSLGCKLSEKHKKAILLANINKKRSIETIRKMSLAQQGNRHSAKTKRKMSLSHKGVKLSKEHTLKIFLSKSKCNPNYEYCDVWKSREYRKDIRKDYCENVDCKKDYKQLQNHHIHLDKKKCAPIDIMTLCSSCHIILHRSLEDRRYTSADPKDFIIINRPDHVSYIHKKTHKLIRINRRI